MPLVGISRHQILVGKLLLLLFFFSRLHYYFLLLDQEMTFIQNMNSGALAGVFTTIVMVPGERIKCLLQVVLVKLLRIEPL